SSRDYLQNFGACTHKKPGAEAGLLFFFQAEDGIRDLYVTGVQTCALPIFFVRELISSKGRPWENGAIGYYMRDNRMPLDNFANRSEERRVGKECRCWWTWKE